MYMVNEGMFLLRKVIKPTRKVVCVGVIGAGHVVRESLAVLREIFIAGKRDLSLNRVAR